MILPKIALSPMPRRGSSLSECLFAFVEVAIGSYCGYLVLSTLNRSYAASREMSEFVLRPAWIIFFMPPCMACLGLVLLFHDRIKARLFNDVLKRKFRSHGTIQCCRTFFTKSLSCGPQLFLRYPSP